MAQKTFQDGQYTFVDEGEGPVILVLHGLFGALSNFHDVVDGFKDQYRVIIPVMPIYDMPMRQASLEGLLKFIEGFVELKGLKDMILLGNSLGGHVALMYTLAHPEHVKSLVLTGSSGLFENTMGGSFPKRGSYDYIKERVEYTFYDPKTATKELVDECFEITSSIPKCMNIVQIAKSAQRNNMADEIPSITAPTCLIWGLNDTITPPHVGHEFNRLIPNSELHFIDKCCHAPMMEQPEQFNRILKKYLEKLNETIEA
ncbi:alpha/beta fold hydrolase [Jiulongibacter sediminis]|jgi:pimeloyl-ACP methyl ester carboxylesterase|uniref:Alpha/beta hydrolase n=1 Tax=Jiulongibacter sediminis TaxID=1605367 RepID=A0A0P7C5J0_9BACT|nr:alpha/beta hydrolase [Jiulongibacter sediminis]KPM50061.1 alpha/beta hydrolase [Jiulongibacter sediminis]TBX27086.1 alpha/beta hydrolase [Jiulongibacter sediminis]